MNSSPDQPKNLNPDGSVPASRMNDAQATQTRVGKLLDNDNKGRSRRRTLAKGLVDGNPPYSPQRLRNAGRADACNVNWRQGEALLSQATSAFYDVFSEGETYASIQLDQEDPGEQERKSKIVTEEWDKMLKADEGFDNNIQVSLEGTVLYGRGPLTFSSKMDWRPRCVADKDLLVPDSATSNVCEWQEACILATMTPDRLYSKIRDEKMAVKAGWDVQAVKQAIIHACSSTESTQEQRTWEYYQERIKTQSQLYSDDANMIRVAHYYVREFPDDENPEGAISHTVVLQPQGESSGTKQNEFLFKKLKEYDSWRQIIHPMYYDNLGGGKHYAVTGLGQKMYGPLEFQNRMLCHLGDKAFAPDTMVEPGTESDADNMKIVKMGAFGIWPKGAKAVQAGVRGNLQDGSQLFNLVGNLLNQNLAGYRSTTPQKQGNPVTAKEFEIRAGEQSQLGATQLNRYLTQLDWLYDQMYRRAINVRTRSIPGGAAAMDFIDRCKKRGVSRDDLMNVKCVLATRVIGKGSQVQRQQALANVAPFIGTLPANGQINFMRDYVAAHVGVRHVDRYIRRDLIPEQSDEHNVTASLQVAGMKTGVPAVVIQDQNHETFATVFIKAGADALQSVEQGGDPASVLGFLDLVMPAAAEHLQYMEKDKNKKGAYEKLSDQWEKVAKLADQLREFAGQTPKQQEQADNMSFQQKLDLQKAEHEMKLAEMKTRDSNRRSDQKIRQQMASKDVQLAEEVRRNQIENELKVAESRNNNGTE